MRVLWSVNTVPPDVAKILSIGSGHAVSWVDAMSKAIKKRNDIDLAIVAKGNHKCAKLSKTTIEGIIYYVLPFSLNSYEKHWEKVILDYKPEVIHIYGTEKKHNLDLINKYEKNIPILISLQGIVSEYAKYYYAGLQIGEILKNYTVHDIIFRNGIISGKKKFVKQGKFEVKMLKGVRCVEGRSEWDHVFSAKYNRNLKYYYCPRMIRSDFFNYSWDKNNIEKHSLLVHQGDYPIKGLHFMLDALAILVEEFKDVKLYISGNSILSSNSNNGYIKIIKKKIKCLNLQSYIEFTGFLNSEEMAKKLASVNLCVIPSAIENAPNALAEAMIVGTPCVASFVGGNADMLNNGQCGLLYPYDEPEMLASKIKLLFESEDLQEKYSKLSSSVAKERHDPVKLPGQLVSIYTNVIGCHNSR